MRATALLIVTAVCLAACDGSASGSVSQTKPASGPANETAFRLAANDSDRARVCRAATDHFADPAELRSARALDSDTVRLEYDEDSDGVALIAECDFAQKRVTWRTVDGATPAQFSPETAEYGLMADTVRLTQLGQDGSRTETKWTSKEWGSSVEVQASAGSE